MKLFAQTLYHPLLSVGLSWHFFPPDKEDSLSNFFQERRFFAWKNWEVKEGGLSQGYVNVSQMEKSCKNMFVWSRGSTVQGSQKAVLSSSCVSTQRRTGDFSPSLPPLHFDNRNFNTSLFRPFMEAGQLKQIVGETVFSSHTFQQQKKKKKGIFLAKPVSLLPSLCCLLQGSRAAQAGGGSFPAGCGCGVLSFWHCLAVSWACSDFVRCSLHTSNSLGLFSLQSTAATLPTRGKQSKAPSGSALPFSNTSAPLFLEGQGSGFPPLHSCFIGYRSSCVHFPLSCLLSATTTELTWLLG